MKKFLKLVSLVVLVFPFTAPFSQVKAAQSDDLNQYLYSLNYDGNQILAQNGEKVTNVAPTSGTVNSDGSFTVIKREKKSLNNQSADLAVIASNGANVYPGALVKADSNLAAGDPAIISAKRAPLTLSVDLPGMSANDSSIVVDNPTASGVRNGLNTLLNRWNTQYATDYPNVPAKIEYSETMAYSLAQLKTKFGTSFEKLQVPLNIDFDAINSGEKQVAIVNFRQIYYTVNVDAPEQPGDVFGAGTTVDTLKNKGLTANTPPAYVSNVSYGRSIYLKLETSSQSNQVKAAFNAAIKGVDISNNTEYQDILKNTSVTAVVLGGDAGEATKVINGDLASVKEVINQGARYNKLNPGVPIAYKVNFLKDNAPAKVQSTSDYVETNATTYQKSLLNLDHSGAYVAKFFVTWDEVSYDANGKEVITPKAWSGNGQNLTAHWSQSIQLPGNARNLRVVAQEATGLAWEWWRTIYDQQNIPLTGNRTIYIWGTTLYPKVLDTVNS